MPHASSCTSLGMTEHPTLSGERAALPTRAQRVRPPGGLHGSPSRAAFLRQAPVPGFSRSVGVR
eukprot:363790-Chlamydomonas_euryale.AAC.13